MRWLGFPIRLLAMILPLFIGLITLIFYPTTSELNFEKENIRAWWRWALLGRDEVEPPDSIR